MVEYSRRALLLGGAAVVGVGLGGAAVVGTGLARTTPAPSQPPRVTRTSPMQTATPRTVATWDEPTLIASIRTRTSPNVMQQFQLDGGDTAWITQSQARAEEYHYTTVVARCGRQPGTGTTFVERDAMTVVDGGHGLGLAVERLNGRDHVWISLQGTAEQREPDGGRLARFRYSPGTYSIDAIPGGVEYAPQLPNARGELQEAIYNFDWAEGVAVERMYDFHGFHEEQHTLRRISDIVAGVDRRLGRITLPVDPPTMQGFATLGDSLFRWVGTGNAGSGAPAAEGPMTLEQYDWRTGALIARRAFPTLGHDAGGGWRDGAYEPEGCAVLREADGSASLLVGVTTGSGDARENLVYRFAEVGSA